MRDEHVCTPWRNGAQRGEKSGNVEAAGIEPGPRSDVTGSGGGELSRSPQRQAPTWAPVSAQGVSWGQRRSGNRGVGLPMAKHRKALDWLRNAVEEGA